jgi:enterochelin esterase family protein
MMVPNNIDERRQPMTQPTSAQPVTGPTPAVTSPEVLPDGRVTFRIWAPRASEVTVDGDWTAQGRATGGPLQRDSQGVWSITVGPLVPDFYTYAYTVDGVRTLDPNNTWIKPGSDRVQNILRVPGEEMVFAETQPVPHGDIRIVWYDSVTLNRARRMHIYTPPGYDRGRAEYPVLYLIHGGGDDDAAWPTIGRAGFIMDNLLAAGQVTPMIIVMPNGKIDLPGFTFFLSEEERKSPAAVQQRIETIARLHDTFAADLLTTIMPTVEQAYRVRTDRTSRAIAGLSMGGAETLRVAPSNLDKFAAMGVFSMGLQVGPHAGMKSDFEERNAGFFANPDRTNELLKLLWIAAGVDDAIIGDGARRLAATLQRRGIRHEFHESAGGHTWINWRQYLHEFLQLLFRD